jgi:conjugative transfer signal peptidase TraF
MTARGARGSWGVWGLASAVALLAAGRLAGLRLNLTGSLPVGLYVAARGAPARGRLVLVCLPPRVAALARARGYVPRGGACPGGLAPIGKRVVAVAGDTVDITTHGLSVNGVPIPSSQALAKDRRDRPLPHVPMGRYVVRPGTVWIVSSYSPFSFDSRYFGAVESADVHASIRRLWTAGSD